MSVTTKMVLIPEQARSNSKRDGSAAAGTELLAGTAAPKELGLIKYRNEIMKPVLYFSPEFFCLLFCF
jgi:hypothetical protein